MIYLDYAATTPADPRVIEEFINAEQKYYGNPLSAHDIGRIALCELEKASAQMSEILSLSGCEIIFTSSTSEANNLAIKGFAQTNKHIGKHILSTCLEHPSVSGTLAYLKENGFEIELIKIKPTGKIDLDYLASVIRKDTILLAISAIDSELGIIQPIEDIHNVLEKTNCKLFVDAAQAMGKIQYSSNWGDLHIDLLTFTPHKFYGLKGIGILVKRNNIVIEPMIHGGGISLYRSGTPSVPLILACLKALQLAKINFTERINHVSKIKNYLIESLKDIKGINLNSPICSSPFILNLSLSKFKGIEMQKKLNAMGIAVSVKSACSVAGTPSRPVLAITGSKKIALSSWRLSFSHLTTFEEIDTLIAVIRECL